MFLRDLKRLTPAQQSQFNDRLRAFRTDLLAIETGRLTWFRTGLRVKKIRGVSDNWEMTWSPGGRATFAFGNPVVEGKIHIVWLRIGGHEILP